MTEPQGPIAVGYVECRSVARGVQAADAMVKAAEVTLRLASPTCPGKYLIMVTGLVAPVRAAVEAGKAVAAETLTDWTVIPSVHPQVIPALGAFADPGHMDAIGVIETFTMAAAVRAADEAVKAAAVRLVEVRLGRGLAGKAFVVLTGSVAAVRAAIAAATKSLQDEAMLLGTTVVPSPHPQLIEQLL